MKFFALYNVKNWGNPMSESTLLAFKEAVLKMKELCFSVNDISDEDLMKVAKAVGRRNSSVSKQPYYSWKIYHVFPKTFPETHGSTFSTHEHEPPFLYSAPHKHSCIFFGSIHILRERFSLFLTSLINLKHKATLPRNYMRICFTPPKKTQHKRF